MTPSAKTATALARSVISQVQEIPLDRLDANPLNPRKTFDEAGLKELAASIKSVGITQPLLVRWLRSVNVELEDGSYLETPFGPPADSQELIKHPKALRTEVDDRYEIIAGHRRYAAATLLALETVPCIVRDIAVKEAQDLALIDNLQRADLPAMEEAEAFGELLARPGATIETIAAALAKSPSYVGRRLKLLDAVEPVRKALKLGAIEPGHALELARLSARQQEQLLTWLEVGYAAPADDDDEEDDDDTSGYAAGECIRCGDSEEYFDQDGTTWFDPEHTVCSDPECVSWAYRTGKLQGMCPTRKTVAELRNRIGRTQLRVLRDVPFPLDDEIPPMACTACPKRASGAASLFADIAEDTCTDPECLDAKLKVWVKAQLEAADREGRKLAMLYDGHTTDKAGVSRYNCVVDAACVSQEQAIWVNGPRVGHLIQFCRDKKCPEHGVGAAAPGGGASTGGTKGGVAKPAPAKQSAEDKRRAEVETAERAKLAEKLKKEREYRGKLFAAIAKVPDAQIDVPRIALLTKSVCFRLLSGSGQFGGELAAALGCDPTVFGYGTDKLEPYVRGLTLQGALRAAALRLVVDQVSMGDWEMQRGDGPERMEQIARWLGIDVKSVRSGKPPKAAGEPKKAAAKAAAKKPPAKKAAKKAATPRAPVRPAPKKAVKKGAKR